MKKLLFVLLLLSAFRSHAQDTLMISGSFSVDYCYRKLYNSYSELLIDDQPKTGFTMGVALVYPFRKHWEVEFGASYYQQALFRVIKEENENLGYNRCNMVSRYLMLPIKMNFLIGNQTSSRWRGIVSFGGSVGGGIKNTNHFVNYNWDGQEVLRETRFGNSFPRTLLNTEFGIGIEYAWQKSRLRVSPTGRCAFLRNKTDVAPFYPFTLGVNCTLVVPVSRKREIPEYNQIKDFELEDAPN